MTIRRETHDDEAGVAENLFDLANVDADAGKSDLALANLRNALAFLQQRVGERHPLAIQIHRRMGVLLREKGLPGEAAKSVDAALALSAELLGERHPTTLALHRQRAAVYMEQGWLDVAERDLRDTTPLLIERVGEEHTDVGSSFYTLGMLSWEQGKLAEAERDLAHAVHIWRATSARTRLVRGIADHAEVLQALDRHDDAMREVGEAKLIAIGQLGKGHPLVGEVEHARGLILANAGDEAGAIASLTEAVRLLRAGYGPTHPRTLGAQLSLARERARSGRPDAITTMQRIASDKAGGNEPRNLRWRARAYLAEAQCRTGAGPASRDALDVLTNELRVSLPQGGRLPREVDAIRAACTGLAVH
jgi:serine/threonine-protein kinase